MSGPRSIIEGAVILCVGAAAAVVAAAPAQAASDWSGCYAGLNGGYSFDGRGRKDNTGILFGAAIPFNTDNARLSGVVGGAEAGCNVERSHIVLGAALEGWYQDLHGTSVQPAPPIIPDETVRTSIRSTVAGAASVRLGVALGPALIYGKAGIALSSFRYRGFIVDNASGIALDRLDSGGKLSSGYLVGGGAEFRLSRRVSTKIEYNYIDYGSENRSYSAALDYLSQTPTEIYGFARSSEHQHLVKAGIMFHFL